MSGQLKEVRTRISSVMSTQQITKAMKMVSAAKLKRAQDKIIQMRPYANKLNEIMENIVAGNEENLSLALAEERPLKKALAIVVSSDRGLCGGFNSNVIKRVNALLKGRFSDLEKTDLLFVGKKAYDYFKSRHEHNITDYVNLFAELSFEKTAGIADYAISAFLKKDYDRVVIVYAQFKNAATQDFVAERLLPLVDNDNKKTEDTISKDFIFEPSKEEILNELIPKIVKTKVYKAVLESNASEHGARMTAMEQATENANDLLRELRLSYNRARQAAITTELTEIVSGAAALEEG